MSLTIERFVETGFGWPKPSPNSQKCYRNHIRQLEAFLKERNKTAQDGTVADQDILDYIEYLKSKYQPNTVAAKVAATKSYFKWLKKEGALTYKPYIRSFPSIKVTHKELERSDLDIMLRNMEGDEHGKQRDRAMFALMVCCGFKTQEIVAMNREDINFETAEIEVIKNHRYSSSIPRKEKISFQAAFDEVQAYEQTKIRKGFLWIHSANAGARSDSGKEPFFLNKYHLRISGRSVRRRLTSYLGKSSQYTMRDLRHTYVKNWDCRVQIDA